MPPEKLKNAYIVKVTVDTDEPWAGGQGWPDIPLCVETGNGDTIDVGDLSRPHFWWANHHFSLVREITDDHAEGDQYFYARWGIGISNDGLGPIDWEIGVITGLSSVYRMFPPPDLDWPNFTWTGSLMTDQFGGAGLSDSMPLSIPQPLGFKVTREVEDSLIEANAENVTRSFTLSVTTTDAELDTITGYVNLNDAPTEPVTVSSFNCTTDDGNGSVYDLSNGKWWAVMAAPGEYLPLGTFKLNCEMTLSNKTNKVALYKPRAEIQTWQQQYSARYVAVSSLEVNSPFDNNIEPRDQLGISTYEVWEAGGKPGDGLFDLDFFRVLIRQIVFLSVNENDTTPPVIETVTPSPAVLWPPNHKMVPVTVTADASDNSGNATCKIISITSNEAQNGLGDGDTAPDWEITGDLTVNLRAERSGTGTGRVYTINVRCSDSAGNTSNQSAIATVPINQG